MPEPLVVVGCGGHGREVLGVVQAVNEAYEQPWKVLGVIDDTPSEANLKRLDQLGVAYLGPVVDLASIDACFVIGIGDPRVRALVDRRIGAAATPAPPIVHPDSTVGPDTALADGVVIFAGARITTNVSLGRHVHVNQNATVGHDSVLDTYVSVNPLAAVSGDCRLASGVLVGTTAAVLQGLSIGANSIVGAGACVTRDVPANAVVVGVPARQTSASPDNGRPS